MYVCMYVFIFIICYKQSISIHFIPIHPPIRPSVQPSMHHRKKKREIKGKKEEEKSLLHIFKLKETKQNRHPLLGENRRNRS